MSPAAERHAFAVLDACGAIHGSVAGTGDDLGDARLADLARWLEWRLTAGWEPSLLATTTGYDTAVRALGCAALALAHQEIAARAARVPPPVPRDAAAPGASRR